jgi:spore coat protein U-like protein
MRLLHYITGFAAIAATLVGNAQAAGSGTLGVSANVLVKNSCAFKAGGTAALNFGTLDPSNNTDVTATAQRFLRCTGSAANVLLTLSHDSGQYETAAGANRMRHATDLTEFLPYTTNLPSGVYFQFVPTNVDLVMNVNGTVRAGDYRNARAGTYSDTISITVTP